MRGWVETGPLVSIGSCNGLEWSEGTGQGLVGQGRQLCRGHVLRFEHDRKPQGSVTRYPQGGRDAGKAVGLGGAGHCLREYWETVFSQGH